MKRTLFFFIIVGTMFTAACSLPTIQTSWSKPGAQHGEFERAQAKCEEDLGVAGLGGQAGFDVCMKRKGWFRVRPFTRRSFGTCRIKYRNSHRLLSTFQQTIK